MSFSVEFWNDLAFDVDTERLSEAAAVVLRQHNVQPGAGLTIVITSDEGVAALNQQFRGLDAPTDVLSFPAGMPPVQMPGEPPYLGDIIIAYPYAAAQAARERYPFSDNLVLLVVHGVLHLLGYDHDTPAHRAAMWAAQDRALKTLNIPLDLVPSLEADNHDKPPD